MVVRSARDVARSRRLYPSPSLSSLTATFTTPSRRLPDDRPDERPEERAAENDRGDNRALAVVSFSAAIAGKAVMRAPATMPTAVPICFEVLTAPILSTLRQSCQACESGRELGLGAEQCGA